MHTDSPFYLDNLVALRTKLEQAEANGTRMGEVWSTMRRRVRNAPNNFPWFAPFTAMITQDAADLEAARNAIRRYVASFEPQSFGMGLQFHFWCFAFPHARWSLYFQWLDSIGAWDPAEAKTLREKLITFQFVNFFYGMRTKPEPECVDNQSLSLCFSNALLGHLFGGEGGSAMCDRMAVDGFRRLPSMLGGMPPSGYSGEGSTYMDHVVGPSIPFIVELMERVKGGNWYDTTLEPNGGSAATVVRMIAREWTPTGLTLPWDHYGYSLPTRACMAYGAYKTHEPIYFELLDKHADWCTDMGVGWGVDDLVWSLIWWPTDKPDADAGPAFPSWAEPTVGAALVSDDAALYLMQMWDETNPGYPTRAHVNPNSLVLCAHGSPLTVDGVIGKGVTCFDYPDTIKRVGGADFNVRISNFGQGCAGTHNVLLVDGWEGMRALTHYQQADLVHFDATTRDVTADVTPLYREHYPDALRVRRRSRLAGDLGWVIEDLAAFTKAHEITARFYLRPQSVATPRGVAIETVEGVRLTLFPILGPDTHRTNDLKGYPDRLDGASVVANFTQTGETVRWLWFACPQETRRVVASVANDWRVVAGDADADWSLATGLTALAGAGARVVPCTRPAYMLADLPPSSRWWYSRTVTAPAGGGWLRLPRGLMNAALWLNGQPVDLTPWLEVMKLMPPQIPLPAGTVEVVLRTDCGMAHYDKQSTYGAGFSGEPAVLEALDNVPTPTATWHDGVVSIRVGSATLSLDHTLLAVTGN